MSDYQDDLKCEKVIRQTRRHSYHCNKSPARLVPILNVKLCKDHQKEMSEFIDDQLGEVHNR